MLTTLALILVTAGAQIATPAKTVLDGAYTSDQARRGQAAYEVNCASCHMPDLSGRNAAKPLTGEEWTDRWREYDLEPLFSMIRTYMPPIRNGKSVKLSDDMYLDIIAFILQGNGFPAGAGELRLDTLEGILYVGKDGPKPVPAGSLIRTVGCLEQVPDSTAWMLVNATEPVRAKESDKTTPAELKSSAAAPHGSFKFRLVNFDYIAPDFRPDPLRGHRVQTKGFLIRQPNAERINLTSLESVSPACAQ